MDRVRGSTDLHVATVLGNSSITEKTPAYTQAVELGKLLTKKGFVVANGGRGGVMEASHRGARAANGHTIEITVEANNTHDVNAYADEHLVVKDTLERSDMLYRIATIVVVLPGDLDTLGDLTYAWDMNKILPIFKPIFLIGSEWAEIVSVLKNNISIDPEDWRGSRVVNDLIEFDKQLQTWIDSE